MPNSAWPPAVSLQCTVSLCLPFCPWIPTASSLYTLAEAAEAAVACREGLSPCHMLQTALPSHSVGGLTHLQAQEAIAQALEDWDPKSDSHALVSLGDSALPSCSQRLACPVPSILAAVNDCMHDQPQSPAEFRAPAPARSAVSVMHSLLHQPLPVLPLLCALAATRVF